MKHWPCEDTVEVIATDNRFLKTVLQFVVRPVPASILTALFNFLTCYFLTCLRKSQPGKTGVLS